jgi:hypothetical protein
MATSTTVQATRASALQRRPFYIGASLLMGLIAVVGFWPTYFGPLVTGTIAQPLLIHIHATVFTGWLVLFLTQAVLAATKHVTWHLRVGKVGIGYGALLVVVGLITGVLRSSRLPLGGPAEDLLFAATADMIVFSGFFAAAIVYRRKPQVHKRLMMVAANMLLIAAVARMTFIPPPPAGFPLFFAIWFLPLISAMAYDYWRQRRIHTVYLIGVGVFVVRILAITIHDTEAWRAFTRAVVESVTPPISGRM